MEIFHFRSMISPGNLISLREKIDLSLSGRIYKKTACKNKVFLAAIITFLVLISTPSAYAVFIVEPQAKNLSNNQSSNLSGESYFLSNELLVKLKSPSKDLIKTSPKPDDTGIASLNNLNKKHGISKFEQVAKPGLNSKKDSSLFNWYKITFEGTEETITKKSVEFGKLKRIIESYKLDPNIETVELNYKVTTFLTPNDTYYSSYGLWGQSYSDLWGIQIINASAAWNQTTGSSSIIVADIDTGADRNHSDLKDNMWVNTAEIPNNGIDDDGNGYVDDYYGWNWVSNTNDPMDDNGHGTHTAGTIAAVGNNGIGVVGVNWKSRIMSLKFLDSSGSGSLSNAINALQYAADMGAKVSSNSWGCYCNSVAMDDAIQYEHDKGMIVVVAAGNSNADALDFSPASADMAITVAASNHNDAKSSFSNWGEKIDVAAPGGDAASWGGIDDYILSLKAAVSPMCPSASTVGTNYCIARGTSMATPHVAGLAALILSKNPNLTNEEVRQIIRAGATDLGAAGKDIYYGYGRIDANKSVSLTTIRPLSPYISSPRSRTVIYGSAYKFLGSVPGLSFASYKIEAGAGRMPTIWTTLYTSTTQVINGTLATIDTTQLNDGIYIFRITATATSGKSYQFQIHDVEVDNFDIAITSPFELVAQGIIDISGSANTKNGLPFANYKLEWGAGTAPTSWSTAGITLVNGGSQPVSNGKLGTADTSNLTQGQAYSLRLTVTAGTGATSQYSTTVTMDKDIVAGWPKLISNSTYCFICESTPTIADIDGDGVKEVVIPSSDNKIYVFRKDGTNFLGFPVSVAPGEYFTQPANVADLDNDGKKEIVAAAVTSGGQSKVYVIRSDGTFYPGWPNPVHVIAQDTGDGTPTIADLDGDGKKELVVIDPYYKKMHAYHLDGTELAGFPKTLPFSDLDYPGAPSIFDLDKDGKPEIAYGLKNKFYLFDENGTLLPGWPFVAPAYNGYAVNFHSSAASGDIDGDGNLEVIAIGNVNTSCSIAIAPMYAWKKDGSLLPNWPMAAGPLCSTSSPMNTPSIADVDGDGKDEAVVGLNTISIFDLEGKKTINAQTRAQIAPAISDVDGDGRFEFSGVTGDSIKIGKDDGSIYWQRIFPYSTPFYGPAVLADLDNNSKMKIAVVHDQVAYLWEMPNTTSNSANDWPMFGHDPQRTGRLPLSAPTPAPTPTPTTPTVMITSPSNSAILNTSTVVVGGTAADTGGSGVQNVQVSVDADAYTLATGTTSWSFSASSLSSGSHEIIAKATDNAGNTATTSISITVDTTSPTVLITSPSNGAKVSRKSSVTITVNSSDDRGVKLIQFYVNGALQCSGTGNTCNWSVPAAKPGTTYSLQAKAYDLAGNIGSSAIVGVTSI